MARASSRQGGGASSWILGGMAGAALTFATPAAILCGGLLAPAILAMALDPEPGRAQGRIVALAGSGFVIPAIWRLQTEGPPSVSAAVAALQDPGTICPAWLACAVGWGLSEYLPVLLRAASTRRAAQRVAALEQEAEQIRATWVLDPAG